jgi:hypothetical protein
MHCSAPGITPEWEIIRGQYSCYMYCIRPQSYFFSRILNISLENFVAVVIDDFTGSAMYENDTVSIHLELHDCGVVVWDWTRLIFLSTGTNDKHELRLI